MKKLSTLFALLALAAGIASAQYTTTITTLSAPMAVGDSYVTLTSSTGVLPAGVDNQVVTALYIDSEYMEVVATVNPLGTGTQWTVRRSGASGTTGGSVRSAHLSGATVYLGPPGAFDNGPNNLTGSCSTSAVRPNVRTHAISRCVAGVWQQGAAPQYPSMPFTAFTTLSPPNPIAVNSTAGVAGSTFFSQLYVPNNATLTGACLLNGSTVGNSYQVFVLFDAAGNILANSAIGANHGTLSATASKYNCVAFSATVAVVGPATYYVGVQTNGTTATDTFATYAANSAPTNYGTNSYTGTDGTLAALTPTVTFSANKGPLMMVY